MKAHFQFIALPYERFAPLFDQSDEELRVAGACRMIADEKPGFPCRVSLVDAEVGETVLLLPFTHQDVPTPYRASGPIFIRRGASTARPDVDEIPVMFRHRLLSVRAYDTTDMLSGAQVVTGTGIEATVRHFLTDAKVSYLHVHNAGPGCYNCRVVRA